MLWMQGAWAVSGALLGAPMWGPAVIPPRRVRLARIARRLGAVAMLLPLWLWGSVFLHQLRGWPTFSLAAFPTFGTVAAGLCLVSLALLLWPDLRRER